MNMKAICCHLSLPENIAGLIEVHYVAKRMNDKEHEDGMYVTGKPRTVASKLKITSRKSHNVRVEKFLINRRKAEQTDESMITIIC